jgi:hypothetical protein
MIRKMAVTFAALLFGLIVPILEVNATHLLNPLWPSHARLHEAWQLLTNTAIALTCVWLAWRAGRVREAAALALLVVGGFLIAWATGWLYGGNMLHTDGTQIALGGVNVAVVFMVAAAAGLVWVLIPVRPDVPERGDL